jgi:hypothetical protein
MPAQSKYGGHLPKSEELLGVVLQPLPLGTHLDTCAVEPFDGGEGALAAAGWDVSARRRKRASAVVTHIPQPNAAATIAMISGLRLMGRTPSKDC